MCKRSLLLTSLALVLGFLLASTAQAENIGWWTFDEGSGNIAYDSSGNNHHAEVLGTPEWVAGPTGLGSALDFTNTRGANAGDFDPTGGKGVFSLAWWCRWDGTGATQHFFTKSDGWGDGTMMFQVEVKGEHKDPNRINRLHLACKGFDQAVLQVVPADEWAHMGLVFDGTNATGYLNGVDEMGPQPTGIGAPVDCPVWIGVAHNDQRVFQGMIDDMRVFDRVLSEDEIITAMAGEEIAEVADKERLIVPKTSVAPVIDGELDGVWHNVGEARCLITDIVNADSATPEDWYDLFGTFKAMYDDDNFYIFVEVQDSVLDYEFSTWNGDGVEIFFDGDNSKGETYDGVNDNQIRITIDDVEMADIDSSLPIEGAAFKVLVTDLGYTVEAAFPLEALQISPSEDADTVIGFEVQINDNDSAGGRETLGRWFSDDNDSWKSASLFGEAQLVSRTVGDRLDVAKVAFAPNIDGVMEADWQALPEITGNKYVASASDLSKQNDFTDARFSFRTGWDDENIYFFVSIIDDMFYDLQTNHQADGIELFFDADNSKGTTREDGRYDAVDDVQLRINHADLTPADIDITGGQWGPANVTKDNINFVVVDTLVGYDIEFAIPLADLAIPAENGHVFGFDIGLNDADEDIRDNIRKYWSGDNDNWRYAALFAEAVLVGDEEPTVGGDSNPIGWWTFDEGSGAVAADGSGNGLDGAISGAAWVSPGANGIGSCLDFDGQGTNRVSLGNFDVVGSGLTIACWYKADNLDTPGSDPRVFSKAIGGASQDHWFMVSSTRVGADKLWRFRLKTDGDTSELKADTATGQIDLDVWTHVAAVWDGATMRLYKNGVEVGSLDKGGTLSTNPEAKVSIGNQPEGTGDRPWDGLVDDVRLYNRGLSADEILEIMSQ